MSVFRAVAKALIVCLEWSGINALLYYGPYLMRTIGMTGDTIELIGSGGIGIVQFLAVLPAILYIDRLGLCFALHLLC